MKKIRVLELITDLSIGGAEKVLSDLCLHLDKSKIEPFVIGLTSQDDLKKTLDSAGVFVKVLNMKKNLSSFIQTYRKLSKIIHIHNIDIIHAHMFHPLVFACALKCKNPKLKIIWTSHSENIYGKMRELFVYFSKAFREVDIVFSKEMRTKMYKKNSVVIANGIDLNTFKNTTEKKEIFTFLNIGGLREAKNQYFLASCAKYLNERGYDFQIDIVGRGNLADDCSQQIREAIQKNGVKDKINMLGEKKEIAPLLQTAHCFVLPSLYEGLPIALLEAGAAKLPILSTPAGAIPDVLDKNMGYTSDLTHFAQKMEYILNNYDEAKFKADCFYEKVNRDFSIQGMAKAHEEVYKKEY